jgi:hypothetical protein
MLQKVFIKPFYDRPVPLFDQILDTPIIGEFDLHTRYTTAMDTAVHPLTAPWISAVMI